MRPLDTSERAYEIQIEILRRQTPSERFEAAVELSEMTRRFALAGVRSDHPDASDRELLDLLIERWYGVKNRAT
jgi:hypothetical protein